MGNYKARRDGMLQAWQITAAEYMFQGKTDEQICALIFNVKKGDEKGLRNGKARLRTLRKNETFQEYYRSIITEWSMRNAGKALCTIAEQMDDKNPWVRNKAANDVLNQSKTITTGVDDNTVVVKVEGMPALGSPSEEDDA